MQPPSNYSSNIDLSDVLVQIRELQRELGQTRSDLRFWADGWRHPDQLDEDDLERLLERLCICWADRFSRGHKVDGITLEPASTGAGGDGPQVAGAAPTGAG